MNCQFVKYRAVPDPSAPYMQWPAVTMRRLPMIDAEHWKSPEPGIVKYSLPTPLYGAWMFADCGVIRERAKSRFALPKDCPATPPRTRSSGLAAARRSGVQ